jgi:hypothetical protein
MKRIAFLVCGLLLLVANTAEARRNRWSGGGNYYSQPTYAAPANYVTPAVTGATAAPVANSTAASDVTTAEATESTESADTAVTTASATSATTAAAARTVATLSYSTSTAQGVANLMAAYGRVGHFGGNPGYEGCGCGATPAAAYSICCYGNSGMSTVDVGYAQGRNGMWYCCRRYR